MSGPTKSAYALSILRVLSIVGGVTMLISVLVLHWHGGSSSGGAYSVGRGLWGVGVRLPWIIPLLVASTMAVLLAVVLDRNRFGGAAVALTGLGSIVIVITLHRTGAGLVVALIGGSALLVAGCLAAVNIQSHAG